MSRLMIWYGHLTSRPRLLATGGALLAAGVLWLAGFLLLPGLALVGLAFAEPGADGGVVWRFSADNFRRLTKIESVQAWVQDGAGQRPVWKQSAPYLKILLHSAWVALVTTVLSAALAYPLAFFIAARPRRSRYLWLALVMIPFCTNLVIRTSAWMLILSSQSAPSRFLRWMGILPEDAGLYPGWLAVYLAMVSSALPFMVLPLYTSVERLDWSLLDAARDLYASRGRAFVHAILPQTLPGLSAGVILTFIPAMGMFVVPDLLGGGRMWLIGNLIQQQFGSSQNLPFGAAVSILLMALTLVGLLLVRRGSRGGEPA